MLEVGAKPQRPVNCKFARTIEQKTIWQKIVPRLDQRRMLTPVNCPLSRCTVIIAIRFKITSQTKDRLSMGLDQRDTCAELFVPVTKTSSHDSPLFHADHLRLNNTPYENETLNCHCQSCLCVELPVVLKVFVFLSIFFQLRDFRWVVF